MAQIELQLGKTFTGWSGTYRITADTKPEGRDYRHGDRRTIQYLDGEHVGEPIEQIFEGPADSGGWIDL